MIVKRMVAPDQKVRRYTMPFDETPPTEGQVTPEEIQRQAIARAEQFAHERHYTGPGRFEQIDYAKALAELSPEARAIERGLHPVLRAPTQQERASRHFSARVQHFTQQGRTRSAAIELAQQEEQRSGLHEVRANLPKDSPWARQGEEERREEAHRFSKLSGSRIGGVEVRLHAAGSGPGEAEHENKLKSPFDEVARRIAADCMFTGEAQPSARHRSWAASWYAIVFPPPAPVAGGGLGPILAGSPLPTGRGGNDAGLIAYNADLERTVNAVMEAARTILRDPAKRAQLSRTPLGQ